MLDFMLLLAAKDLKLALIRGNAAIQALLLGLLLIFVFSLSQEAGEKITPTAASAIFWLSSAFCQILIFNQLYSLEERAGCRQALALLPVPAQSVWLGKAAAAFVLLLLAQSFFFPAAVIFLGMNIPDFYLEPLIILLLADVGLCALGSLLGAIGGGRNNREAILSILLFPLIVPLLLAGINGGSSLFGGQSAGAVSWLGMAGAFDALFLAAGLLLFGFLFQGDD